MRPAIRSSLRRLCPTGPGHWVSHDGQQSSTISEVRHGDLAFIETSRTADRRMTLAFATWPCEPIRVLPSLVWPAAFNPERAARWRFACADVARQVHDITRDRSRSWTIARLIRSSELGSVAPHPFGATEEALDPEPLTVHPLFPARNNPITLVHGLASSSSANRQRSGSASPGIVFRHSLTSVINADRRSRGRAHLFTIRSSQGRAAPFLTAGRQRTPFRADDGPVKAHPPAHVAMQLCARSAGYR